MVMPVSTQLFMADGGGRAVYPGEMDTCLASATYLRA